MNEASLPKRVLSTLEDVVPNIPAIILIHNGSEWHNFINIPLLALFLRIDDRLCYVNSFNDNGQTMIQKNTFQDITLIGGTHGNEYLGPTIINRIEKLQTYKNSHTPVSTYLANLRAYQAGLRFIDVDLNRSFRDNILSATASHYYEHCRAREINHLLGPKLNQQRFIIDLHSTTANMGMTLILRDLTPFNLKAAAYTQQQHSDIKLILSDQAFTSNLTSICEFGLTIEVGPIANAVIRHDQLLQTEAVIKSLIEFINLIADNQTILLPHCVEAFQVCERILYPRTPNDKLAAIVHQDLQDQDFQWLAQDDPVFYTLDGKTLHHKNKAGYPVFINEAAYYHENTAFVMTDKISLSLNPQQTAC